jgi:hypothetical protein
MVCRNGVAVAKSASKEGGNGGRIEVGRDAVLGMSVVMSFHDIRRACKNQFAGAGKVEVGRWRNEINNALDEFGRKAGEEACIAVVCFFDNLRVRRVRRH